MWGVMHPDSASSSRPEGRSGSAASGSSLPPVRGASRGSPSRRSPAKRDSRGSAASARAKAARAVADSRDARVVPFDPAGGGKSTEERLRKLEAALVASSEERFRLDAQLLAQSNIIKELSSQLTDVSRAASAQRKALISLQDKLQAAETQSAAVTAAVADISAVVASGGASDDAGDGSRAMAAVAQLRRALLSKDDRDSTHQKETDKKLALLFGELVHLSEVVATSDDSNKSALRRHADRVEELKDMLLATTAGGGAPGRASSGAGRADGGLSGERAAAMLARLQEQVQHLSSDFLAHSDARKRAEHELHALSTAVGQLDGSVTERLRSLSTDIAARMRSQAEMTREWVESERRSKEDKEAALADATGSERALIADRFRAVEEALVAERKKRVALEEGLLRSLADRSAAALAAVKREADDRENAVRTLKELCLEGLRRVQESSTRMQTTSATRAAELEDVIRSEIKARLAAEVKLKSKVDGYVQSLVAAMDDVKHNTSVLADALDSRIATVSATASSAAAAARQGAEEAVEALRSSQAKALAKLQKEVAEMNAALGREIADRAATMVDMQETLEALRPAMEGKADGALRALEDRIAAQLRAMSDAVDDSAEDLRSELAATARAAHDDVHSLRVALEVGACMNRMLHHVEMTGAPADAAVTSAAVDKSDAAERETEAAVVLALRSEVEAVTTAIAAVQERLAAADSAAGKATTEQREAVKALHSHVQRLESGLRAVQAAQQDLSDEAATNATDVAAGFAQLRNQVQELSTAAAAASAAAATAAAAEDGKPSDALVGERVDRLADQVREVQAGLHRLALAAEEAEAERSRRQAQQVVAWKLGMASLRDYVAEEDGTADHVPLRPLAGAAAASTPATVDVWGDEEEVDEEEDEDDDDWDEEEGDSDKEDDKEGDRKEELAPRTKRHPSITLTSSPGTAAAVAGAVAAAAGSAERRDSLPIVAPPSAAAIMEGERMPKLDESDDEAEGEAEGSGGKSEEKSSPSISVFKAKHVAKLDEGPKAIETDVGVEEHWEVTITPPAGLDAADDDAEEIEDALDTGVFEDSLDAESMAFAEDSLAVESSSAAVDSS
eukprot:PLAT3646.5.p1 GENE.PLAT3646.5~~PLAT3646.5.p1  ORF type:complete len:1087 (-),score=517.47 PLAT3646.5:59-3319(-)